MINSEKVFLVEVGPRDGFQGESKLIPSAEKLHWIKSALAAGLRNIQITSFVNSKIVPQMADAEVICSAMRKFREEHPAFADAAFSALALNPKGMERAIAAQVDSVDISMSASETHSQRNARRTQAEAFADLESMVGMARDAGIKVRVGLQCAFGCGYEGSLPSSQVISLFEKIASLHPDLLSLADSTGTGHPHLVSEIVGECLAIAGETPLVLHLHDTFGRAMLNLYTALELGVRHFDTAFGGLGGCPFIPGATGNLPTEDVALLLHDLGYSTGVNVNNVVKIRNEMCEFFERSLPGKSREKKA